MHTQKHREEAFMLLENIKDPVLRAYLKSFLIQLEMAFVKHPDQNFSQTQPDSPFDYIFFMKVIEMSYHNNRTFINNLLMNNKVPKDPFDEL